MFIILTNSIAVFVGFLRSMCSKQLNIIFEAKQALTVNCFNSSNTFSDPYLHLVVYSLFILHLTIYLCLWNWSTAGFLMLLFQISFVRARPIMGDQMSLAYKRFIAQFTAEMEEYKIRQVRFCMRPVNLT